jgi:hypothetical protein
MIGKLSNLPGRYKLKIVFFLFWTLFSDLNANPLPAVKDLYFTLFSGHLHQGPNSESTSLKILTCGDKLKVITRDKDEKTNSKFEWVKLQAGNYIGFVRNDFISSDLPSCFNNRYPKFVEKFNLELTDKYNWGRLYDNYVWGKSKVK